MTGQSFDYFMQEGSKALNAGNYDDAQGIFAHLLVSGLLREDEGDTRAQLIAQIALCQRMKGQFKEARVSFLEAVQFADSHVRRGQIYRDLAMMDIAKALVEGQISDKETLDNIALYLRESYLHFAYVWTAHLGKATDQLSDIDASETNIEAEVGATLGFIGRFLWVVGGDARELADWFFEQADKNIGSHNPYELNNLIWWMKNTTSFHRRRKLASRALPLAKKAKNRKRILQIHALTYPVVRQRFTDR
jgi:hypothetical protein